MDGDGELDRLTGELAGAVVVAAHERDAALGEQELHPTCLVEVGLERGHLREHLVLLVAPAGAVEECLAGGEDVEAQAEVVGGDEFLGAGQHPARLVQGVDGGGTLAGAQVPGGCRRVVGALVVLGDHGGVLVLTADGRAGLGQPLGGTPVVALALGAQHPVVRHVAEQRVLEQELAGRREPRDLALEEHLAPAQAVQAPQRGRRVAGGVGGVADVRHGLVPEDPSDHGGTLEQVALLRAQGVQPGLEHPLERRGNRDGLHQLVDHPPVRFGADDDAGVEQPGHQLLDVERVALRGVHHEGGQRVGELGHPAEELRDQLATLPPRERAERQPHVVGEPLAPPWPGLQQGGPRRRDHEDRRLAQPGTHRVQPPQRALVGPVQVLEQDHHGHLLAEHVEVAAQELRALVPECLRVRGQLERRGVGVEAEPRPDQRAAAWTRVRAEGGGEPLGDGATDGLGGVVDLDAEPRGEHVAQQAVDRVLGVRRGAAPEPPDRLGPLREPGVEVEEQPGLADSGVAHHRHQAPGRLVGHVEEPVLQEAQLQLPTHGAGLDALDAADAVDLETGVPLGAHHPGVDRVVDALEVETRSLVHPERAADLSPGLPGDEDPVDRRRCLQPTGAVDRRSDRDEPHAASLVERADHHLAGVDAHAHVQGDPVAALHVGVEHLEVAHHRQGRAHRTVGVVLVGAAQAVHRHHRVADELLDDAALVLDRPLPAGEVGADDLAGVLGVELPREHGEVDEIGEDDGDEPALLGAWRLELRPAGPQRRQRGVDHRVPEQAALGLEGTDRLLDRGDLVGRRGGGDSRLLGLGCPWLRGYARAVAGSARLPRLPRHAAHARPAHRSGRGIRGQMCCPA